MTKAVQIGAGNIGRGLNGFLFHKNNCHITFLDVFDAPVKMLNSIDAYTVNQVGETSTSVEVNNFDAINLKDLDKSISVVADASIVFISIGISNLHNLSKLFKGAIAQRIEKGIAADLNIVAVENGLNASSFLKDLLFKELSEKEIKHANDTIAFPNCAVDRIVPNQSKEDMNVQVETFYELVIEEDTWKGKKLDGVVYSKSLGKFLERKLYMLNAVHAYLAWYGIKTGMEFICDYTSNSEAKAKAESLLKEFVTILESKFDFTKDELEKYASKILSRLANPHIKDEVTRVGRGIKRKVSNKDRFIMPLTYAVENNLKHESIVDAISFGFSGIDFDDVEVKEINKFTKENGIKESIKNFTGLTSEEAILDIITRYEINKVN